MYSHVPFFLLRSPHSSRSSQSTQLSSLRYAAASHQLSVYTQYSIYINATFLIHPTISFPRCVHMSILYVCIPTLQINSSVLFF